MADFEVHHLLQTDSLAVWTVRCNGSCRHRSPEECSTTTQLVFPYRGTYLRHVGRAQAVADANHVLFFNTGEGYQVSHPVDGGDRSMVVTLSEPLLRELVPASILTASGTLRFSRQHQCIDPRAQALAASLRHGLENGSLERLESETLLLVLVSRSLGPRTSRHPGATTHARSRLVDRVKVLLAGNLSRRWSLAEIAAEIGGSPVYLTQVFQQVERLPLYRYHLRLRLARALDLITRHDDLATLGLELGFSSHSHFTSAFRQAYGLTPSEFKRSTQMAKHRVFAVASRH